MIVIEGLPTYWEAILPQLIMLLCLVVYLSSNSLIYFIPILTNILLLTKPTKLHDGA